MAYRLSIADDPASAVRVCAREQLEGAIDQLSDADADPVVAIHEARKHLKKTRALLRLVRSGLPKRVYRDENAALREAGLALSAARDADVVVAAATQLGERYAGRLPAETFEQLRAALADRGAAGTGAEPAGDPAAVLSTLHAALARVGQWPLERAGWDVAIVGSARAYERGRDAFAAARDDPSAELLHAWRKRTKDLWYHHRLLAPAWPEPLAAYGEEAHRVSELLGDDHDLVVLRERIERGGLGRQPQAAADRDALLELVDERRAELQAEAFRLGHRLYAESPKGFARRLGRYLGAAVEEQQQTT
jgi:CHAD domain-containing protein